MFGVSAAEDAGAARKGHEKMTLLSELAACIIKARPGMKGKYEALPDRRRRLIDRRALTYLANLISAEYEEHCQRTLKRRKRK